MPLVPCVQRFRVVHPNESPAKPCAEAIRHPLTHLPAQSLRPHRNHTQIARARTPFPHQNRKLPEYVSEAYNPAKPKTAGLHT